MKNIGIKYGFPGAVAVVFFFALLYFAGKEWFWHPLPNWGSLAIYLAFMYKAGREDCDQHGYNRDFRMITRTPFIVFLLINLGYWLFYYGIHLADPSLVVHELQRQIDMLQQQFNASTGTVERNELVKQIADLEKSRATPVLPLGIVLTRMAIGALGGFALSAGIAALLRSRE